MTTLRDLPREYEFHYVTCELNPWECGPCRHIEGALM